MDMKCKRCGHVKGYHGVNSGSCYDRIKGVFIRGKWQPYGKDKYGEDLMEFCPCAHFEIPVEIAPWSS